MLKTIAPAMFAAVLATLVLSLVQAVWVTPLILQAETFEQAGEAKDEAVTEAAASHGHHATDHAHAAHAHAEEHSHAGWAPEDGWQRHASTAAANLVMAAGFALMLAGLLGWKKPASWRAGLGWGAAGYVVFFLAPALGLPPELPGAAAAELTLRQAWWVATALATAVGLALLVWARPWWLKVVGLIALAIPHVVGAPHPETAFALAPEALAQQFIVATAAANALFWLVLGFVLALLHVRGRRQLADVEYGMAL